MDSRFLELEWNTGFKHFEIIAMKDRGLRVRKDFEIGLADEFIDRSMSKLSEFKVDIDIPALRILEKYHRGAIVRNHF